MRWIFLALLALATLGCTAGSASTPAALAPTMAARATTVVPTIAGTPTPANGNPVSIHWPGEDWSTSRPEDRDLDPERLAALVEAAPERAPGMSSLLVVRGGDLVVEEYFGPAGPGVRREIYSVTKSFVATLIGIALDRGDLSGLDLRLTTGFPDRTIANPSPGKEALSLEDVLTMRSGLDWTEGDPAFYKLTRSPDWVQFMLDQPVVDPPGSRFNYCTGCSHLLSALLQESTGTNTLDFARRYLFEPMGIEGAEWRVDSQGIPNGGWGLQLTPREMARLGYLYLRGGAWDGRQVVSRAYIEAAVSPQVQAEDGMSYGYQWWVMPSMRGYAALGLDGQMVAVIPEKDLVVVFTSRSGESGPLFELIETYLLPAAR